MVFESTVFIIDDEPGICNALRRLFKLASVKVETYTSAQEFLLVYNSDNPGCILLDIQMPKMSGLELQKLLAAQDNRTPVIFLTGTTDVTEAVEALKEGAFDFIKKPFEIEALINCVKSAFEFDLRTRVNKQQRSIIKQRLDLLTPREREVMRWIIDGKSNKMIARLLDISSRTVEIHRRKVMKKMQVNSVADLVQTTLKTEEG